MRSTILLSAANALEQGALVESLIFLTLLNLFGLVIRAHKSVYKGLIASGIWPPGQVDAKGLKQAYARRRKRADLGGSKPPASDAAPSPLTAVEPGGT